MKAKTVAKWREELKAEEANEGAKARKQWAAFKWGIYKEHYIRCLPMLRKVNDQTVPIAGGLMDMIDADPDLCEIAAYDGYNAASLELQRSIDRLGWQLKKPRREPIKAHEPADDNWLEDAIKTLPEPQQKLTRLLPDYLPDPPTDEERKNKGTPKYHADRLRNPDTLARLLKINKTELGKQVKAALKALKAIGSVYRTAEFLGLRYEESHGGFRDVPKSEPAVCVVCGETFDPQTIYLRSVTEDLNQANTRMSDGLLAEAVTVDRKKTPEDTAAIEIPHLKTCDQRSSWLRTRKIRSGGKTYHQRHPIGLNLRRISRQAASKTRETG